MAYKGTPLFTPDEDLFEILQIARDAGVLVMVHAENGDVIAKLQEQALARGDVDPIWHARTRPEAVEAEATGRGDPARRDRRHGRWRVVHVTCAGAAEQIRRARDRGQVTVHGETCPQYLVMTIDDLAQPEFEGAKYVCSPPLRDASNQEPALARAARPATWCSSARTTARSTSPARRSSGRGDFTKIPNGMPGVEERAPLLWTHGVRSGRISPETVRRRALHQPGAGPRPAAAQGPDRARRRRGHRGVGPRAAAHHHARQPAQRATTTRPTRASAFVGAPRARVRARRRSPTIDGEVVAQPGSGRVRAAGARQPAGARSPRDARSTRRSRPGSCASSRELTGDEDGAQRVAWTDRWIAARDWLRARLAEIPGRRGPHRPGRQHLGGAAGRERAQRGRRRPPRLGARRRLARRRAERRRGAGGAARDRGRPDARRSPCGWSTGPTRRAPASAAAWSARAPAPDSLDPDALRGLRDRDGVALPDALAAQRRRARPHARGGRRAATAWPPTSSCTSSRGRCSSASTAPLGVVTRHLRPPAPPRRLPRRPRARRRRRRWTCAATRSSPPRRSALAFREGAVRREDTRATIGHRLGLRRASSPRSTASASSRSTSGRSTPGVLAEMVDEAREASRADRRRGGLRGRVDPPVRAGARRLRRRAGRDRRRRARGAHRRRRPGCRAARCTTPPRWRAWSPR